MPKHQGAFNGHSYFDFHEALEEAGVRGDLMASLGEYDFRSKTLHCKSCPQGLCKAEMFVLHVKECSAENLINRLRSLSLLQEPLDAGGPRIWFHEMAG